jgi:hypothetical protein
LFLCPGRSVRVHVSRCRGTDGQVGGESPEVYARVTLLFKEPRNPKKSAKNRSVP